MRQEPLGLFHRSRRRAGRIGLECLPRLARPPAQLAASMMPPGPERQKRRRTWRVCGGCCCAAMALASLGCACGKAECLSAPYLSPWGTKRARCGSTDYFGMARFAAHCTRWSHVLGRVLVDLGTVCVSREKSCGGRSASTVTLVNVRPVLLLLFHKKLRESAHDRVRQTRGRIRYHLPLRERAPHCESDRFIPKRGKQAQVEIVHSGR
jgi:hypothetical protein